MGNICRSPTAEGVFRTKANHAGLLKELDIDSAGTIGYHVGSRPDQRAQEAAKKRGYDLSKIKSRKIKTKDFKYYLLVFAFVGLGAIIITKYSK